MAVRVPSYTASAALVLIGDSAVKSRFIERLEEQKEVFYMQTVDLGCVHPSMTVRVEIRLEHKQGENRTMHMHGFINLTMITCLHISAFVCTEF